MAWYDEYDKSLGSKFNQDEEDETLVQLAEDVEQEETEEQAAPLEGLENILSGGGGYTQTLKQDADEATAAADAAWKTMGGIAGEWQAEKQRRADELKPRFTQAEIDDRRAKSTALSTLTSALANVANGIAVAKGGLNATVPDGYQAAYEHWNDVQKRHDARRAEYDKLVDAVWQNRYGMSKAEYDRLQAEAKTKQGLYHGAVAQESKQRHELAKEAIKQEALNKRQENQQKFTAEQKQLDRENSTKNAYIRKGSSGGGGGGGSKPGNTGKEYGYVSDDGMISVTFPQGMDEETAYKKMSKRAMEKIVSDIADIDKQLAEAKTIKKKSERDALEKELTAKKKEKEKLRDILRANSSRYYDKTGRTALGKNIAASGISQEELEAALNGTQEGKPIISY